MSLPPPLALSNEPHQHPHCPLKVPILPRASAQVFLLDHHLPHPTFLTSISHLVNVTDYSLFLFLCFHHEGKSLPLAVCPGPQKCCDSNIGWMGEQTDGQTDRELQIVMGTTSPVTFASRIFDRLVNSLVLTGLGGWVPVCSCFLCLVDSDWSWVLGCGISKSYALIPPPASSSTEVKDLLGSVVACSGS